MQNSHILESIKKPLYYYFQRYNSIAENIVGCTSIKTYVGHSL